MRVRCRLLASFVRAGPVPRGRLRLLFLADAVLAFPPVGDECLCCLRGSFSACAVLCSVARAGCADVAGVKLGTAPG